MTDKFWTLVDDKPKYRNLKKEENKVRNELFQKFYKGEIDEALVIYYEVYDCHSSFYIDNSIYQNRGCFLKEGDHVLDLGANIGIFTNFAADKGAAKIYSFEPILENFHMLMMNRPEQCEAHRLAISDKDNESIKISFRCE